MNLTTTEETRWTLLKNLFKRKQRVSILVDGPNFLRKVGNRSIRLEDIDAAGSQIGQMNEKYVLLNHHASKQLIQAVVNSGYTPIVTQGNIHLTMGLRALEMAYRNESNIVLIASRDARCAPILLKLKEKGIKTATMGFEPGFSTALKNISDFVLELSVAT